MPKDDDPVEILRRLMHDAAEGHKFDTARQHLHDLFDVVVDHLDLNRAQQFSIAFTKALHIARDEGDQEMIDALLRILAPGSTASPPMREADFPAELPEDTYPAIVRWTVELSRMAKTRQGAVFQGEDRKRAIEIGRLIHKAEGDVGMMIAQAVVSSDAGVPAGVRLAEAWQGICGEKDGI